MRDAPVLGESAQPLEGSAPHQGIGVAEAIPSNAGEGIDSSIEPAEQRRLPSSRRQGSPEKVHERRQDVSTGSFRSTDEGTNLIGFGVIVIVHEQQILA